MVIDDDALQVHGAALVNCHGNAEDFVVFIHLRIHGGVEIELVLEAAAAAADAAETQEDSAKDGRGGCANLGQQFGFAETGAVGQFVDGRGVAVGSGEV